MKTIARLTAFMFATGALAHARGLPVNLKTGTVTVPHTVISLSAEQVEETQILHTLTLTSEQWREIRAKSPGCPRRFDTILPVTYTDCDCCWPEKYVIVLSRDRVAVLHDEESEWSVSSIHAALFKDDVTTNLRMNERGEFYIDGRLLPFQTLLKALAVTPEGVKRDKDGHLLIDVVDGAREGEVFSVWRSLYVELPIGMKPSDAAIASRLQEVVNAAKKMGFTVDFSSC